MKPKRMYVETVGENGKAMEPGKDYRLLKVVTEPAAAEQFAALGNDRTPVVYRGAQMD